jgi:hypothetical protein
MSLGEFRLAVVAGVPSPLNVLVPVPAMVVITCICACATVTLIAVEMSVHAAHRKLQPKALAIDKRFRFMVKRSDKR